MGSRLFERSDDVFRYRWLELCTVCQMNRLVWRTKKVLRLQRVTSWLGVFLYCAFAYSSRAAAPPGRYTVQVGTVRDTKTGLTWQQDVAGPFWSSAAIKYCADLSLNGGNWRIPELKELETLIDNTVSSPSIDTSYFPSTPPSWFWTSTLRSGTASTGWFVKFDEGTIDGYDDNMFYLRCVRK